MLVAGCKTPYVMFVPEISTAPLMTQHQVMMNIVGSWRAVGKKELDGNVLMASAHVAMDFGKFVNNDSFVLEAAAKPLMRIMKFPTHEENLAGVLTAVSIGHLADKNSVQAKTMMGRHVWSNISTAAALAQYKDGAADGFVA